MTEVKERAARLVEASGRVRPRGVLEAYERTGLRPGTGVFVDYEHGEACAYGVLAVRRGIDPMGWSGQTLDWMNRIHGDYAAGFYCAFDGEEGLPCWLEETPEGRTGWRDGKRVRRFVFGGAP